MKIGDVIKELERAKPDATVTFDFGGIYPTTVDSWRGSYDEAALGFSDGTYGDPNHCDVKQLLERLRLAIDGRTYSGWKGGHYSYTVNTLLHIDNRGNSTNTEITEIEIRGEHSVVIHTERGNDW